MDDNTLANAAAILGRKGGSVRSEAKTKAVRENARKPRPRAGNYAIWRKDRILGYTGTVASRAEALRVAREAHGRGIRVTLAE